MRNGKNIHLIINFNGEIPLHDFENRIISKYWEYVKKGYSRIYIHYIGFFEKPEYLYYFRRLLNINILKTIVIKRNNSLKEAIEEVDGESYEVLEFD